MCAFGSNERNVPWLDRPPLDRVHNLVAAVAHDQREGIHWKEARLAQIGHLSHAASELEAATDFTVEAAREAGASWAEIGHMLDITRQAAQQKYGLRREAT